jgi:hypothetical protein
MKRKTSTPVVSCVFVCAFCVRRTSTEVMRKMEMEMGKSHIDKIQCVENVMTFEPLLLVSISKKCFQNASCARQRIVLSGVFRGKWSSMYGGSVGASVHVCGLCLECFGHYVSNWRLRLVNRSCMVENEHHLPGQTIAFSNIIAVMRNVLLPYPQALRLTLLCMACMGADGLSCCKSIASRFSCW